MDYVINSGQPDQFRVYSETPHCWSEDKGNHFACVFYQVGDKSRAPIVKATDETAAGAQREAEQRLKNLYPSAEPFDRNKHRELRVSKLRS